MRRERRKYRHISSSTASFVCLVFAVSCVQLVFCRTFLWVHRQIVLYLFKCCIYSFTGRQPFFHISHHMQHDQIGKIGCVLCTST